jgi:hypothetical protein
MAPSKSIPGSLFTAFFLLAVPASAQDAPAERVPLPPVAMGARVRVESRALGGSMKGTVTALDRSFLTLTPEEGPKILVPLDGVTKLELTRGMKTNMKRGLWMGAVAGAAASLLYEPTGCTGPFATGGIKCSSVGTAFVGAAAGAAVGAAAGFIMKSEKWAPVPLGREPSAMSFPGPQVAVTLRF